MVAAGGRKAVSRPGRLDGILVLLRLDDASLRAWEAEMVGRRSTRSQ